MILGILGIDPGPIQSASVLWDGDDIVSYDISPNDDLLEMLNVTAGRRSWPIVACEHLQCFGMSVGREVFETAYWIGEFRGICRAQKIEFVRVYRSEVKMHFCNSMRAKDANIRQALIDRFGGKGTIKNPGVTYGLKADLWSAFAIAVMVHDKMKS